MMIGSRPPEKERPRQIISECFVTAEGLDAKFRVFIPAAFLVFNIVYWSFYMSR
jgi:hypothetical protein